MISMLIIFQIFHTNYQLLDSSQIQKPYIRLISLKRFIIITLLYFQMYCQDQNSTLNITLLLVNQADGSSYNIPCIVPYFPHLRQFRINEVLDDTCQRGLAIKGAQLFHVDFAKRMNVFMGVYPLQNEIRIKCQSVVNGSIQINMKPTSPHRSIPSETKQQDIDYTQAKSKKVKERTIAQAVQSVRLWRKLYDTDDGNGKRMYTLDEAAKIVGIAKKTLDDYYSLIRTALNYGFHLQKFKENKIGIIRKFVKIARDQGQQAVNKKMGSYLCDQEIEKYWANDLNDL